LRGEALRRGVSIEEFAVEVLSKALNIPLDPSEKVELHLKLAEKLGDGELRRMWWAANNLHQNFYENWMTPRDVKYAIEDVKGFIGKLRKLL
jgi:hypothetical protein